MAASENELAACGRLLETVAEVLGQGHGGLGAGAVRHTDHFDIEGLEGFEGQRPRYPEGRGGGGTVEGLGGLGTGPASP